MSDFKNEKDRREYPRFELPVQLHPTEYFGKEGRVLNVSIGGVRIFGTKSLDVGTILEINFALPNGEWVTANVRVVWVKEFPDEPILKYDIGCRYTDIPPESQTILSDYLAKITPRVD